MTFFSSLEPFHLLTTDHKIKTEHFLLAAHDLAKLCDVIGSTPLARMKLRMTEAIKKEQELFGNAKEKYEFLDAVIKIETGGITADLKGPFSGILLIIKAAEFLWKILDNVVRGNSDLYSCVDKAHAEYLRPYQPVAAQDFFAVGLKAVTNMTSFIQTLGNGHTEEEVLRDMRVYAEILGQNIKCARDIAFGST